jgi:hypothetical protein
MTVSIQFFYIGNGTRVMQKASFPLKGRQPEEVAFAWWKQIKREMYVDELEKVICNGEDITQIVKDKDTKEISGEDPLMF